MTVPTHSLSTMSYLRSKLLQSVFSRRPSASNQGLTIMECLVAIMLIGLTAAMVTPPVLIATATRVQTRRAEQAMQLAQDEVDRINTLVQQGQHENRRLPGSTGGTLGAKMQGVAPPAKMPSLLKTSRRDNSPCPPAAGAYGTYPRYTNQSLTVDQALPVDVDGDCNPDFLMQVFRTDGPLTKAEQAKPTKDTQRLSRFDLGVRVYSFLAAKNMRDGKLQNPAETATLLLTQGQGKQTTNPLASIYKSISWGERSEVLCEYLSQTERQKVSACK